MYNASFSDLMFKQSKQIYTPCYICWHFFCITVHSDSHIFGQFNFLAVLSTFPIGLIPLPFPLNGITKIKSLMHENFELPGWKALSINSYTRIKSTEFKEDVLINVHKCKMFITFRLFILKGTIVYVFW